MPRAKKGYQPKIQLLDMPLPYTGLDQSFPLALQRPGTTPTALNVRGFNAYSGRRSLSRRRGTIKGFNNQIAGSAPMQELNSIIGTGYVNATGNYIPGSYYVTANVLVGGSPGGFTNGFLGNWVNGTLVWSLTLTNEPSIAAAADVTNTATGSDGSAGGGYSDGFYIYSYNGSHNFVTKYAWVDGSTIWRTDLGLLSGDDNNVYPGSNVAMAVGGGIVYISIPNIGLFRLNSSNGSAPSANPWIDDTTINGDHSGWATDAMGLTISSCYLDGYYTHPIANDSTGVFGCLLVKADGTKTYILNPESVSGSISIPASFDCSQAYTQDGDFFYHVAGYKLTAGLQCVAAISKFDTTGTVLAHAVNTIGNFLMNPQLVFDGAANAISFTDVFGVAGTYSVPTGLLGTMTTLGAAGSGVKQPYVLSQNGGYGSRAFFTFAGPGYWSNGYPANWQANTQSFTPQFLITANPGVSNSSLNITNYNRQVTVVGVANGDVAVGYGRSWSIVVNGVGALNANTQVIRSDSNVGNLYFADGVNFMYYHPSTNSMLPWVASQGQLPIDSSSNAPRLICTWNGRTVLSGLPGDPQDWFMSAQGDPTNWAYNPSPSLETQAVAGNNSPAGKVGDVVTALIPYNDDVLIFGGDHTIFQMTGDPMAGGRIDRVSDITGIAWGNAWCKTPNGGIYFFGSRGSVYFLNFSAVAAAEGNLLTRVSQAIDQPLSQLNMGNVVVRMAYDDRWQGLHVFISARDGTASTHYYYDETAQAWWSDQFGTNAHNPFCLLVFDGDDPADRCIFLGDQDGWARQFQDAALDDDGTIISSNVLIGPGSIKGGWEYLLNDLQCDLDQSGGSVNWSVKPGYSAQVAFNASPLFSGVFAVGRNHSQAIRAAGIACYVDLYRAVKELPWAVESLRGKVTVYPHTRQRVF